ncbi:MAG: SusC/RagA family TonB-linked outer membrane protein [Saprospiraceae bacterium]|nr:MAG: SusC/RagA family TonB-linked outer membrane protein [Saprospiraceae bacterium]
MLLFAAHSWAQQTVSGVITTPEGEPLIGVNITEMGTTNGTISDIDGAYTLTVKEGATLVVSIVGYAAKEIEVGTQSVIDVQLEEGVALDEVVVTALGISKEKKSLGYSVTEVAGEELTQARENNVINSLAGKVAGVNITSTAGGPASSTRVIIRGNSSLAGNNQPLYVVDGVPIDNTNLGAAGMWGGTDLGDGLSSINPDDIETVSVLKGPSATALYGTRGQNGVILINTKRGKKGKALGIDFNSNFVVEDPLDFYKDIQFDYGAGSEGEVPDDQEEAINTSRRSWGAKYNGQTATQFDGSTAPYVPHKDNVDKIYDNGQTFTNTLAFSGGSDDVSFRVSGSNLTNDGLFENVSYERNSVTARGTANLGNKVYIDAKGSYSNEQAVNRPALSDSPHNPGHLNELASSVDFDLLKQTDPITGEYDPLYSGSVFRVNPYFGVYQQHNDDTRDRIIGHFLARYNFTDWLSLHARAGTDWFTFRQTTWDGERTPHLGRPGRINENETRVRETNIDFLMRANRNLTDNISLDVSVGGNQMRRVFEKVGASGEEFIIYGLRTVSNTKFLGRTYEYSQKRVNSFYGTVQVGFNNYLYLDLTARNDWSSTLPKVNNSYFYPSASLSYIFSEALNIPNKVLSFGKARISYAQVGGDTDPYKLALTYQVVGEPHQSNPQGQISQNEIPNANLKPTNTSSIEAGLDLRFFNNRIGLDLAWYDQKTTDQILSVNISQTSGFNSVVVNAGEIKNSGLELLLTTTPIRTKDFTWDLDFNFAANKNEVVALDDDGKLESLRLEESRQRNTYVEARLGNPYGAIVGYGYRRDAQGRIVYNSDGLPLATEDLMILGSGVPDWFGGLSNTFTYKGFSLGVLLDIRWGSELHSMTNLTLYSTGKHINTVEGRDGWAASEAARISAGVEPEDWDATGGYHVEGVNEDGEAISRFVDPEIYFPHVATNISEEFIYSANMIKVRQASLSYNFPRKMMEKTPFQGLTLSLVARNLFFLYKDIPNVDPESNYQSGNGQGLEYATIPTVRSYGVNLNVKF